jgi:hypothetical protein
MHSSRYMRETSYCMHNMHVSRIYNRLRWYSGMRCVRRDVRRALM